MIYFSLVCLRLKPVLLERAFHELDTNFRWVYYFPIQLFDVDMFF